TPARPHPAWTPHRSCPRAASRPPALYAAFVPHIKTRASAAELPLPRPVLCRGWRVYGHRTPWLAQPRGTRARHPATGNEGRTPGRGGSGGRVPAAGNAGRSLCHAGGADREPNLRAFLREAQVRPDPVQLGLVVQAVEAEHKAQQQPDQAHAGPRQPGRLLHLADPLARAVEGHERRHDDDPADRDREQRQNGIHLDPRIEVAGFAVDLVPPDEVVDPSVIRGQTSHTRKMLRVLPARPVMRAPVRTLAAGLTAA